MVPLIDLDRDAHCNCTNVLAPNEDSEEGAKRHGYEDIVGCNSPNQVRSVLIVYYLPWPNSYDPSRVCTVCSLRADEFDLCTIYVHIICAFFE